MFQRLLSHCRKAAAQLPRGLLVAGLLVCVLLTAARSSLAAEEVEAPLCDPDVLASGGQIECERPAEALPQELPQEFDVDSDEAPMCDETGASIGARLQIPEVDRGRFDVLPCEALWALLGEKLLEFPQARLQPSERKAPLDPAPHTLSRAEGARAGSLPAPEPGPAQLLAAAWARGIAGSVGHHRLPYRPPLHPSVHRHA